WMLETAAWEGADGQLHRRDPLPYDRPGPGIARDGKPKFDLTTLNVKYFDRLRARVAAAQDRGIYVSVMLFNGWSLERKGIDRRSWLQRGIARLGRTLGMDPPRWDRTSPWHGHPFNKDNNVNGIDGDRDRDGEGLEIHTLTDPNVTAIQERYVKRVVDTVNDLDNVLYEISNESQGASIEWQEHMVQLVHSYEATKPKRHPVLMTWAYPGGKNDRLIESPAEAISPGSDGSDKSYRLDPPAADGRKVIIADTDHLWGEGGDAAWVWKSFMRGHNPIFMDRIAELTQTDKGDIPGSDAIRNAMGRTREISERIDLRRMTPMSSICSTTYCLADPSREYLIYAPAGGPVTVSLGPASGRYAVEWINPEDGSILAAMPISGGRQMLHPPSVNRTVVHIKASDVHPSPRG
ncbi:MAG TPA: hypothetical protein VFA38_04480, partial [Nitrospirales bacterium]|nr:hypothetical protein [Nitrospirales bacterium]